MNYNSYDPIAKEINARIAHDKGYIETKASQTNAKPKAVDMAMRVAFAAVVDDEVERELTVKKLASAKPKPWNPFEALKK